MKKITWLLFLIVICFTANAQSTLTAGDIAFVGSNTGGATNADDNFSFVLLKDIAANTEMIFTDRGWNDLTGFSSFIGDGEFTWVSSTARSAGEIITLDLSLLNPAAAAYSYIGDQLFAVQGSIANPIFIAGINFNHVDGVSTDANWDGAATDNATSALPDALTNGVNAIRLIDAAGLESDNWQFSCVKAGGNNYSSFTEIALAVNNKDNWNSSEITSYDPEIENGCFFTIVMNSPPMAVCKAFTAQLDSSGNVTISPSDVDGGSSDTEGSVTLSLNEATFDCTNIGPNEVELTVTDSDGVKATCLAIITVKDNEAPVKASTGLTALPASIVANVPEASGFELVYELSIDDFTSYAAGANYSVDNSAYIGSNHTRVAYYMELDGEFVWVSMDDFAAGSLTALAIPNATTNNVVWDQVVFNMNVSSNTPGIDSGTGITTGNIEMWRFNYGQNGNNGIGGNNSTYDFDDTNDGNNSYGSFQVHNYGASQTLFALNNFNQGTNKDLGIGNNPSGNPDWTFSRNSSVYGSKKLYILVNNNNAALPDITAECSATPVAPTASDNCAGTVTGTTQTVFPITSQGTTVITWTYDDGNGNTSTQEQHVIIDDITAPEITCVPNTTRNTADGVCEYIVQGTEFDAAFTDNCGGILTNDLNGTATIEGEILLKGDTPIIWTVDDGNGQIDTCTTIITIADNEAPTAIAQDITVQLDENGQATITPDQINNGSTDNCEISSLSVDGEITEFAEVREGQNLTITLPAGKVVTSVAFASYGTPTGSNGNYTLGSCHASNSKSIVEGYALGKNNFTIPATNGVFGDPCSGTVKRLYVVVNYLTEVPEKTFTCNEVGANTVNLIVTDVNGNTSSATATVTVEDNILPVLTAEAAQDINLDDACSITVPNLIDGSSATDNCTFTITQLPLAGTVISSEQNGTIEVVVTATDAAGNTDETTVVVTAKDVTDPVLTAEADQDVELDTTCSITVPNLVDGSTATDNCTSEISQLPLAGTLVSSEHNGTIEVVVTATDAAGNTDETTVVVTAKDVTDPVLTAEADQDVELDTTCSITVPNLVDGSTATDNCTSEISQLPLAGTLVSSEHNETVEVVVTATDAAGNTDETTVVLTAKDITDPVLTAEADQDVELDTTCSITIPNLVDGSSATDNCTFTITQFPLAGTVITSEHDGTVDVIVTATDAAGNTDETTVVLTAKDVIDPILNAEADQNVDLDVACSITIPNLVDGLSATDNCTFTIIQLPLAGTVVSSSHNGTVDVVVTATDAAGNTDETKVVLTAKDVSIPVLTAEADQDVDLDAACSITIPNLVDGSTATDNCSYAITQLPLAGTLVSSEHDGIVEVVVTATDAAGNTDETTVVLTAKDLTDPVLTAEADQDVELDAACSITVTNLVDGSSAIDNCTIIITQSPVAGTVVSSEHDGIIEVLVTATDAAGNTDESTVILTAKDVTDPILTAAADQDVNLDDSCSITVPNVMGTATDNCTVTITQNPVAGTVVSSEHDGIIEVLVTATDAAGNTDETTVVLTAKDVTDPVLAAESDQDVDLDDACSITVPNLVDESTATDNCTVTITQNPVAGTVVSSSHNGTVDVVVTATDAAGNTEETTVMLTAKDVTDPVLTAEANQDVELDTTCSITVPNLVVGSTATDNCTFTITQLPLAGTVVPSEHDGIVEVVVTATDAAGNTDETTVTLTAKDVKDPVLTAEAGQDVNLDASCSITVPNVMGTATDNCTVTITQSPVAGAVVSSAHDGTLEVVVTATDAAGNTDETTVVLTAKDVSAPELTAVEDKIENVTAACEFVIPDYTLETQVTDNCGVSTINQTPVAGTILNGHGTAQTITLTAIDGNGNSASTEFSISLIDKIAPTPSKVTLEDITAACEVAEEDITIPTGTDNCGGVVSVSHNIIFPITTQGLTVITWSFEDANGNIATQTQDVMLEDTTAPVPDLSELESIIVECEAINIEAPTAIDICGGSITGTTLDPLSYSEEGDFMILWEFNDGNGNSSSQEQWVTVKDQTAPEINTQDLTITVDQDEPAVITPEQVNDASSDNCSEIVFALDRNSFDKPGAYEVVLTGTDASGNTSQATATITVKRGGADPMEVHVVPTMLTGTSIAKVILPFKGRIMEVQVIEVETNKYKMFDGNKKNVMKIDVAPMKGTLLVKILDNEGNFHLKKLIAL